MARSMRSTIYVYGIASVAAGIMDLVWGEFEPAHQPIQAWGDHIPASRYSRKSLPLGLSQDAQRCCGAGTRGSALRH
jgi:hypothetical protein